MGDESSTRPRTASMIVLFAVITVSSVALALGTDLHLVIRGVIALLAGLVAAVVAFVIASRITRRGGH